MLEILRFIFSSFWIWLGTTIMLTIIGRTIIYTIHEIFRKPLDKSKNIL